MKGSSFYPLRAPLGEEVLPSSEAIGWLTPVSPCVVKCFISPATKVVHVECWVDDFEHAIALATLSALAQRAHTTRVSGPDTAQRALLRILRTDLLETINARHSMALRGLHRSLSDPVYSDPAVHLKELDAWRDQLSCLHGLSVRVGDQDLTTLLLANTAEITSALSSLEVSTLVRLLTLQERDQNARQTDMDRRNAAEARMGRLVARLGTAAILPSLWLGYWGSQVAPNVANPRGTLVVLGGTAMLAATGESMGRLIWHQIAKDGARGTK